MLGLGWERGVEGVDLLIRLVGSIVFNFGLDMG